MIGILSYLAQKRGLQIESKSLEEPLKLDLGCGANKAPGFVGIDFKPGPQVDIVYDLEFGIPVPSGSVSTVRAHHFLEHHSNPVFIMEEIYRVLQPGGVLEFEVPSTSGEGAFADPEHRSFWNKLSFQYYVDDALRELEGICAKFEIEKLEEYTRPEWNAVYVRGELRAIKSESAEGKALAPFKKFIPPKPAMAGFTETFSAAELWDAWAKKHVDAGEHIIAEPKLNGFRAIAQGDGTGRVGIRFEDSDQDRTKQLPRIAEQLKEVKEPFILDTNVGISRRGKPLPRIALMTLTAGEPELKPGDTPVMTVFDLPYWKEDLSDAPFQERRAQLQIFYRRYLGGEYFAITPQMQVNTLSALQKAMARFGKMPGSEGLVTKVLEAPYASGGTDALGKIKHVVEIKAIVLEVQRNKNGTYSFRGGLSPGASNFANLKRVDGSEYVDLGKSFNASFAAKVGDIVTFQVQEIIPQEKDGEIRLSWLGARPLDVDKERKQPYAANQVIDMARRGHILQAIEKARESDEEGETRGGRAEKFWEEHWYEMLPRSGKGRFVCQAHFRGLLEDEIQLSYEELCRKGRSLHNDLRHTSSEPNALWGLSIYAGRAQENIEPRIFNLSSDRKMQGSFKLAQPRLWLTIAKELPVVVKYLEYKLLDQVAFDQTLEEQLQEAFVQKTLDDTSAIEIVAWGTVVERKANWQWVSPKAYVAGPGEAGATTTKYAKFFNLDEGEYELGVCRLHSFEIGYGGKKLKGRHIFSYAPIAGSRKWVLGKPDEQDRWFAHTHDKEDVVRELMRKKQDYLYWREPGTQKAELIEVAKYELVEKASPARRTEHTKASLV